MTAMYTKCHVAIRYLFDDDRWSGWFVAIGSFQTASQSAIKSVYSSPSGWHLFRAPELVPLVPSSKLLAIAVKQYCEENDDDFNRLLCSNLIDATSVLRSPYWVPTMSGPFALRSCYLQFLPLLCWGCILFPRTDACPVHGLPESHLFVCYPR